MENFSWLNNALPFLIIILLLFEVLILKLKVKRLKKIIRKLEGIETLEDINALQGKSGDSEGRG